MADLSPREEIFRAFSAAEGKSYATGRLPYSPLLYEVILKHHASTGGESNFVLDVGCGPGNCTRVLASSFAHAMGVDASPGMIESARELGGKTKSEESIRYEVSSAEGYSGIEGLQEGSVDLLTVAAAAHWFDMPKFWVEAAKVLKPGGTVAIWTRAPSTCHPSTPNAEKIRAILGHFASVTLAPWEQPGNQLSRHYYDDLPLPWTSNPPVPGFPESQFARKVYDRDGVFTNGEDFFFGGTPMTLGHVEKGLATTSPVKRWRDAHPDLAGTEKDIVAVLVSELKEAMGDLKSVVTGGGAAILLVKKAA